MHFRQICDFEAMHEELSKTKSELSQTRAELVHNRAQKEKLSSQVILFGEKKRVSFGAWSQLTSMLFKVCRLVAIHSFIDSF